LSKNAMALLFALRNSLSKFFPTTSRI